MNLNVFWMAISYCILNLIQSHWEFSIDTHHVYTHYILFHGESKDKQFDQSMRWRFSGNKLDWGVLAHGPVLKKCRKYRCSIDIKNDSRIYHIFTFRLFMFSFFPVIWMIILLFSIDNNIKNIFFFWTDVFYTNIPHKKGCWPMHPHVPQEGRKWINRFHVRVIVNWK